MKIAYLMQDGAPDVREKPLTGPANHVWQVIKELQGLGHQVRLIARYDNQIWKSDNLLDFTPVHVQKMELGIFRQFERGLRFIQSRLKLPYINLFESLRFSAVCQQEAGSYDIYYERMGWMGYGAGLAAKQLGIPLVIEANNGDSVTELKMLGVVPTGLQLRLAVWLMRRAVNRAQHIIMTGEGHRQRFIPFWGVSEDRTSVVENGSELVGMLQREQLRSFQENGDTEPVIKIVFIGAFEPWHGLTILLPAFAEALERGCAIKLVLIGGGTELTKVTDLIEELGIVDHVQLTGSLQVRDLIPHLQSMDIGVSPYCGWMEFSGLKLFDYKAAGLGIIASGQNGQPSVLRHGKTAIIVPPCDQTALRDAIISLAKDHRLRKEMGRQARLEAEQQHSWTHTARNLENIFVQVIE